MGTVLTLYFDGMAKPNPGVGAYGVFEREDGSMKMKTLEVVGSMLLAGEVAMGGYVLALQWLLVYAAVLAIAYLIASKTVLRR